MISSVSRHSENYNFKDLEQVVTNVFNNMRIRFRSSGSVNIKCGCSVKNSLPVPFENNVRI